MKNHQNYAKVTNLDIRPIIESDEAFNYHYREPVFARRKIAMIKEKYTVSRQNDPLDDEQVILWIKNFEVTPEERLAGYRGNYGRIYMTRITPEEIEDEDDLPPLEKQHTDPTQRTKEPFYTLILEKIPVRVSDHPERKMIKRSHPNWGHPKLRQIKHRPDFTYSDRFSAYQELKSLHQDYPNVSILTRSMLFIIVYSKTKIPDAGVFKPIQKMILEIVEVEDGFVIEARENPVQGALEREKINIVSMSFFT